MSTRDIGFAFLLVKPLMPASYLPGDCRHFSELQAGMVAIPTSRRRIGPESPRGPVRTPSPNWPVSRRSTTVTTSALQDKMRNVAAIAQLILRRRSGNTMKSAEKERIKELKREVKQLKLLLQESAALLRKVMEFADRYEDLEIPATPVAKRSKSGSRKSKSPKAVKPD
jgi:hypothetical protein